MADAQTNAVKKQTNPKQLLIVAALAVVLVTVGVVQFSGLLGGGDEKPPQANNSSQQRTANNNSTAQNAGEASGGANSESAYEPPTGIQLPPLAPRDPFRPTTAAQTRPQPETNKVVRSEPRPQREIAGNPPPVQPLTLPASGQFGLQPAESTPPAEPEQPNYTITGVVQGPNSIAILADSEGRRRFVKQGDLLEEGWRVVSIERGKITLRKGKQQVTARVGETTAPNGGNTP